LGEGKTIMTLKISEDVDIVYLRISDAEIVNSDENDDGDILDFDAEGNVVGYEILCATKRFGELGKLTAEQVFTAVKPSIAVAA
jgi:uncharacterized protein YuzE